MKNLTYSMRKAGGFTITELVVAVGVASVAGLLIAVALYAGLKLFAKGSSVNFAHHEVRTALERVCRDIRSSVSVPALLDTSRQVVDNTADAAGVGFSLPRGPVMRVASNANAGQRVIEIVTGSYLPKAGQRLIVPSHGIAGDIESVANGANAAQKRLTLETNLPAAVVVTNAGPAYNVVAVAADLVAYVVVNGELRYYPSINATNYSVLTRRLTNSTPFRIPANTGTGGTFTTDDNRFVTIGFETSDPKYSNLNLKRTQFQLNALVAHNALLTEFRGFYSGSDRGPQTVTASAPPVTTTSPPTTTDYHRRGNNRRSRR